MSPAAVICYVTDAMGTAPIVNDLRRDIAAQGQSLDVEAERLREGMAMMKKWSKGCDYL